MTEHVEDRAAYQTFSLHVDGDLAAEIDAIARQEGVTRSEILRRLLLRNLDAGLGPTQRWVRKLNGIHDELAKVFEQVEETEADDATNLLGDAIEATRDAINALEEFAEDEE